MSATRDCPHGDPACPCQDGDPCHYEPFEETPGERCSAQLRLDAVRDLIAHARQISDSASMVVYVADLERTLGLDAPVPHKVGQNDGAR